MLDITPYSSNVELKLDVDGRELNIEQIARDYFILRDKVTVDATEAELVIIIDGIVERKPIILPNGICKSLDRVQYW